MFYKMIAAQDKISKYRIYINNCKNLAKQLPNILQEKAEIS